ncbi:hypothetical protein ACNKHL_26385 [Shigella flexneri]
MLAAVALVLSTVVLIKTKRSNILAEPLSLRHGC